MLYTKRGKWVPYPDSSGVVLAGLEKQSDVAPHLLDLRLSLVP